MAKQLFEGLLQKKSASTEVWCTNTIEDLPDYKLKALTSDIFASYSGPDHGLAVVHGLEIDGIGGCRAAQASVAGASSWKLKNRKAYGISMSLYDQHPVSGKISGDPIADSFGLCARENSAVMIVADGVNWGEKSRLAARCATYGCMKFINEQLFGPASNNRCLQTTHDVFRLLRQSLDAAQATILRHEGGLTTICIAFICPLKSSLQHAVCVLSVGDSLAFTLSRRHGMREITMGSRDVNTERDIRDAGGALGPVRNGCDPELHNLTLSMTLIDPGDIVFLTTDGISDNFDPVVTKIAVSSNNFKNAKSLAGGANSKNQTSSKQGSERDHVAASEDNDHDQSEKTSPSIEKTQSDFSSSPSKSKNDSFTAHNGSSSNNIDSKSTDDSGNVKKDALHEEISTNLMNTSSSELNKPVSTAEQMAGDAEETCDKEEAEQLRLKLEMVNHNQLVMTPVERHWYAVKAMERIIHEFELFTECSCSAQELTGALLQHVLKLTDSKRKVLENPDLYRRRKRLDDVERKQRDAEIVERLRQAPGKLDHATIVAYEVGLYHGDEDEDYCQEEDETSNLETAETADRQSLDAQDAEGVGFSEDHFS